MPAVARARLEFVTPEGLEACLAELDADAAAGRVRIVRVRLLGLALPNAEGGPGGDDCAYDSEATAGFRVRGRRRKCQLARLCVALLPAPSLAGRFRSSICEILHVAHPRVSRGAVRLGDG